MTLPDLSNLALGDIILAVSTVGGAVVGWIKRNSWIVEPLKRVWAKVESFCPKNENGIKLDAILKQLHTNGGTSLKDALNRIEKSVKVTSRELSILKKRSEARDELNNVASFETDEKGNCINASKHYLALSGLGLNEVLGTGWGNIIADSDREYVFREWKMAVEQKRDFHLRFRYKNSADDTAFPVKVDAYTIKEDGVLIGYLGFVKKLEDMSATQKL